MLDLTFVGEFFAKYGWYLVLLLILVKLVLPTAGEQWNKVMFWRAKTRNEHFGRNERQQATDGALNDIRAKQQAKLNKLTEVNNYASIKSDKSAKRVLKHSPKSDYKSTSDNDKKNDKGDKKRKEELFKKSAAYRYATTGSWSNGRSKAGSNASGNLSSYRPSIGSRYPNRKRGGG